MIIIKSDSEIDAFFSNAAINSGVSHNNVRDLFVFPNKFKSLKDRLPLAELEQLCLNFRLPPFVNESDVDFTNFTEEELKTALARKALLGYGSTFESKIKDAIKSMEEQGKSWRSTSYYSTSGSGADIDPWSLNNNNNFNEKVANAESHLTNYTGSKPNNFQGKFVKLDFFKAYLNLFKRYIF